MKARKSLNVNDIEIVITNNNHQDYISLTDMARFKVTDSTDHVIQNWLRTRYAIDFCGIWEQINNPNFKALDFEGFRNDAGLNSFVLTPQKWIKATNAIGIVSKAGRYGGTFAHKDIAFEFGSWLSPEFKFYLIREFQRLKEQESSNQNEEWNFQRHLTKVNYRIHTDAIKANLIPAELSYTKMNFIYSDEADLLNLALFGKTAKQWREENPELTGNVRDHSTLEQLIVLSNLESLNAVLIEQGTLAPERLLRLNKVAIVQMTSLLHQVEVRGLDSDSVVEEPRAAYGIAS
jgi:hypothetical protein